MSVSLNARLDEQVYPVIAAQGLLLASTLGDTMYVSLKNFRKCQVIISVADGTTVTGGDITLLQATAVAGTNEKPLAFTRMKANVDYAAGKVLTETAVTSNTFKTVNGSNSKIQLYILDIDADTLDVAGGFDCIRVDGASHASTNPLGIMVMYNLYGARFPGATPFTD